MLEEMWSREIQRRYMENLKIMSMIPKTQPTKKPLWKRLWNRINVFIYDRIRWPLAVKLLGYNPDTERPWY